MQHVKAVCGTRDAAQTWQRELAEKEDELGFTTGNISPGHSYHEKGDACGLGQRDDSVFVGRDKHLTNISKHMGRKLKMKVAVAGRRYKHENTRGFMWTTKGIEHESGRRHADRIIYETGVATRQAVVTPVIGDSRNARKSESEAIVDRYPQLQVLGNLERPSAQRTTPARAEGVMTERHNDNGNDLGDGDKMRNTDAMPFRAIVAL